MNPFHLSKSGMFKLLAVLLVSLALIMTFVNSFSGLFLEAPIKFALMFVVLLVGLIFFSASVIVPRVFSKSSGIVYRIAIVTVSILYVGASNLISMLFIAGSLIGYICWEIFAFAGFVGILSVFVFFSKRDAENEGQIAWEQSDKTSIHMQLMSIEASFTTKQNVEGILPVIHSFKALKERIHVSTPFGRIVGNSAIYELEHTIRGNLDYVQLYMCSNELDKNIVDVQNLIDETRRLLVNRETLNVR